jgi:hypothetical protein
MFLFCSLLANMVYRKGELNKSKIDHGWPHQVALPAIATQGDRYVTVRLFCEGLSLCVRGHCFQRGGEYWNVFCFAEREHAELFKLKFGGEFIAPKDRPKWPSG